MNKHIKQLIRDARSISLRQDDRIRMRAHFADMLGIQASAPKTMPWFSLFVSHRKALMGAGMALVVLVVSSGVAVASENTIPGDALYPIKVRVTEEFRSTVARTPAAKAAWEARRIERRLLEAEKLLQKNPNAEQLRDLELRIATHSERIQRSIDKLERTGDIHAAATASSDIEAPLRAHATILREINAQEKHAERLLKKIEDKEARMKDRRNALEMQAQKNTPKPESKTRTKPANIDQIEDTDDSFISRERIRREKKEAEALKKARTELRLRAREHAQEKNDDTDRTDEREDRKQE